MWPTQSFPCISPSGFLWASLPEEQPKSLVGLTYSRPSAAGLGLHGYATPPSLTLHSRSLSPLATALWWPQQTLISEETEPLVVMPSSAWGCSTCPLTVTIGQGSTSTPRWQHVSTRISPYLHGVTAALPPPENPQVPQPIRELSSGLLVPGHKEPEVPKQQLELTVQWDSRCAPREGVPPGWSDALVL